MKSFFKSVFANMLGCLFSFLIISIVIILIIVGSVSSITSEKEVKVEPNTILHLNFDHTILERGTKNPLHQMNFFEMRNVKSLGLNEIVRAIEFAATDKNISAVFIEPLMLNSSWAYTQEIKDALEKFKESGKPIITHTEIMTQNAYFLTQISDKIFLNPHGYFDLRGLASQTFFFKGTLSKLEIENQIIRHGKYKSAIETFTNDKMSPENREQIQVLVNSIWNLFLNSTSKNRNIPVDSINSWANNLSIRTATDAYRFGLVDSLIYKDEVLEYLKNIIKSDETIDDLPKITLAQYVKVANLKSQKVHENEIAVIYAVGEIIDGKGSETTIGSDRIASSLRKARLDEDIKAVVLRVNSPGGSAIASETIWREVELTRKSKPIVVSMGEFAASGGYYIAASASKIIAQPNTITGSIGVFGLMFNFNNFFKNKLGVTTDLVKTNSYSDMPNLTRPLSPFELNVLQNQVENIYDTFVQRVAKGRNMTVEQVDSIAQGRVWSGIDAKKIGLVDEIGGLTHAIQAAAKLANIKDYRITELPEQKELMEQLMSDFMTVQVKNIIQNNFLYQFEFLAPLKEIQSKDPFMTRLPYNITIE